MAGFGMFIAPFERCCLTLLSSQRLPLVYVLIALTSRKSTTHIIKASVVENYLDNSVAGLGRPVVKACYSVQLSYNVS
jgi:hypothetical protein